MSPAMPALLTNVAIVIATVLTVWITSNPLGIFALLLLKEMPVVVPYSDSTDDGDADVEGGRPMGFIH